MSHAQVPRAGTPRRFGRWTAGVAKNTTQGVPAMGLFTKDIKTMDDLFLHGLEDI
jgi:hypothetical protein